MQTLGPESPLSRFLTLGDDYRAMYATMWPRWYGRCRTAWQTPSVSSCPGGHSLNASGWRVTGTGCHGEPPHGGGTTTRVYDGWASEADHAPPPTYMPGCPLVPSPSRPRRPGELDPQSSYEQTTAILRLAILDGTLPAGSILPPVVQLAQEHGVAVGTAHRTRTLRKDWASSTPAAAAAPPCCASQPPTYPPTSGPMPRSLS